jgi:segregation and condensation protein B
VGGARPAARPAARVQDVQGRRRALQVWRRGRPLLPPPPGSRSASSTSAPTCSPGSPRATCATRSCGPSRPSRCPGSTSTTWPRSDVSVTDAVAELLDELPRVWAASPSAELTAVAGRAPRGRRAFLAVLELYKQGLVDLDQPADLRRHRDRLGRWAPTTTARPAPRRCLDDRRLRCRLSRREPAEARAAIEAIVMVADRAGRTAQLLAQLLEVPPARSSELCEELADDYEAPGPGLRARQGGRRLAVPEPPRPGPLRRAVRARGPVGPAVGRRARDAGHRRLQAADLAGPDRRHPRRQRRRRHAHAAAAGYIDEVGRDPGPGQAVLFGTTPLFLEKLGPRLARRAPAARRLRARRRRGRGARAGPAARDRRSPARPAADEAGWR